MRPTSNGSAGRVNLLDVQTMSGDVHYWADRAIAGVPAAITADGTAQTVEYLPWLLVPPAFTRNRSMQTDTGSCTIQNVAGDTLARDFERILRRSAMEGALCVWRYWNAAAEVADDEFHGRISVDGEVGVSSAQLTIKQLLDGSAQVPAMQFSETCQLVWGERRCGATGSVECQYSLQTCQVIEHFVGITSTFYDKNYAEAISSTATTTINRRRAI